MRRLTLITLTVLSMVLLSCQRKVLLEPGHKHGEEVYINIDVDVQVDAELEGDASMYTEILHKARTTTIVAYPRSSTARYGVHKIQGLNGSIWLMPGVYDLLIYTSDFYELDGIYYRGLEQPATAEGYTNSVKVSKNLPVKSFNMENPDPLFAHYYKTFVVVEGENKVSEGLDPRSYKYWFEVNVDGLDYITSASLEIDGMYTSVFLKDGAHRSDEYGTQRVEATIHKDENKIKGEFFSFGPHQGSDVKNSMILTFVNGRTIRVKLDDISPEIKKLRKGGEIKIDQKIVINVDDTGAGFTPNVEDWENEEVVIPL